MIHLINVSKTHTTSQGLVRVIRPTTMSIPADHNRVGILGCSGSGKSTLIRLVSGTEYPTTGRVVTDCSLSWPLGTGPGIHGKVSGLENIRFLARIYGADFRSTAALVSELSELGPELHDQCMSYTTEMRARLIYSLSLAFEFDCYLIDELLTVGDFRFQKRTKKFLQDKLEKSGMLLVSHSETKVREYCTMGMVLHEGNLVPFESLDDAIAFYKSIKPSPKYFS